MEYFNFTYRFFLCQISALVFANFAAFADIELNIEPDFDIEAEIADDFDMPAQGGGSDDGGFNVPRATTMNVGQQQQMPQTNAMPPAEQSPPQPQPQPLQEPVASVAPPPEAIVTPHVNQNKGSGIIPAEITVSQKQSLVLRGDRDYYILESPDPDSSNKQQIMHLPCGRAYVIMSVPTQSELENQQNGLQNIGAQGQQDLQPMELPFKIQ
ncbi:MAG: hypothetical protein LBF84_01820 [Holosporales bacterium]|jgi:hypothetical protein|nr:hypothetical protein [Holosporales bacterium]